jgi:hypothetical protein
VRGLPPPPSDVARLSAIVDIDGARAGCSWWLQMLPGPPYAASDIHDVHADFVLYGVQFLVACMGSGASVVACRLQVTGIETWDLWGEPAPNHGAWGGIQANNVATAVHWITNDVGKGRQSITWVPGFPDNFTDDHLVTNGTARLNVQLAALDYLANMASVAHGDITGCQLGTLHRARHGAPLASSQFAPFVYAMPARPIGRCGRRLYVRR